MRRNKTNPRVLGLIKSLYGKSADSKAGLWRAIAKKLESPRQNWAGINLSRLSRVTKKGETIVVPGKVLGTGDIDHSLTVFAVSASKTAQERIRKAGGSFSIIEELVQKGNASGVRVVR